jgi:hypothetical protein
MKILLPYRYKLIGIFLLGISMILTVKYFLYGLRIMSPVFAIYSSYMETKYLTTFRTNIGDELILLLMLSGFFLIVFSSEKNEKEYPHKLLEFIRIKALRKTIIYYFFWIIFTILFIYGNGFMATLILNMVFPFLIYILLFYYLKNKYPIEKSL